MTKIIFITLAALAILMLACHPHPGFRVTFENRTDNDVRVSVRGVDLTKPAFDVVPGGESRRISYLVGSGKAKRVTIVNDNGLWMEEVFTLSALKAASAGFVIEEDGVTFIR